LIGYKACITLILWRILLRLFLNRVCCLVISLWAVGLSISPSAANPLTPDSSLTWNARVQRVANITYRINTANIAICEDQVPQTGLTFQFLGPKESTTNQNTAARPESIFVYTVVPGSAAAKAGLVAGDTIIAVNGQSAPLLDTATANDMSKFFNMFLESTKSPSTLLSIKREGKIFSAEVSSVPGCNVGVYLVQSKKLNAATFGNTVYIYSAMEAAAANDDQLAFLMAHEISHAILKHSMAGNEAALRDRKQRGAMELAADKLAILLMANAGYNPEAAAAFEAQVGQKNHGFFQRTLGLFNGPYLSTDNRVAYLKARAAEVKADLVAANKAAAAPAK
jgi:hypothetical protein